MGPTCVYHNLGTCHCAQFQVCLSLTDALTSLVTLTAQYRDFARKDPGSSSFTNTMSEWSFEDLKLPSFESGVYAKPRLSGCGEASS